MHFYGGSLNTCTLCIYVIVQLNCEIEANITLSLWFELLHFFKIWDLPYLNLHL